MAQNVFNAIVKEITTITVEKRVHEMLTCIASKNETCSQVVDFLVILAILRTLTILNNLNHTDESKSNILKHIKINFLSQKSYF